MILYPGYMHIHVTVANFSARRPGRPVTTPTPESVDSAEFL